MPLGLEFILLYNECMAFIRSLFSECFWMKAGRLQKVDSLWNKIAYLWNRASYDNETREYVTDRVQFWASRSPKTLRICQEGVHDFFFNRLAKLSTNVFDRSLIPVGGNLERELARDLYKSRYALKKDYCPVTGTCYQDTILEAQFARHLGLKPELASGGSSGTYWCFDRKGNRIGVFKPAQEGPHAPNNPRLIGFLRRIYDIGRPGHRCNEGHVSEVATCVLDRLLDANVTPETHLADIEKKRGSFQLLGRGKEAIEVPDLNQKNLPQFEKFVLLDYLSGQVDRHQENWLLSPDNKIIAIDNGASFPTKHPHNKGHMMGPLEERLLLKKQYDWRFMKQAEEPFSAKTSAFIESLDPETLTDALTTPLIDPKMPSTFRRLPKKLARFREKLAVAKKIASERFPIVAMGSIRRRDEVLAHI